jgi:conjugative transfer region protein TrbK
MIEEARGRSKAGQQLRSGLRTLLLPVIAAVSIAGTAAMIGLRHDAADPPQFEVGDVQAGTTRANSNRLDQDLARCRALPSGADDAGCAAVWEASRRGFFERERSARQ